MKKSSIVIGVVSIFFFSSQASALEVQSSGQAVGACKIHLGQDESRSKIKMKKVSKRKGQYKITMSSAVDGTKERGTCYVDPKTGSVDYVVS